MRNCRLVCFLLVAALQALPASARARDNSQTGLPPVYENLTQGLLQDYVGDEVRIVTADSSVIQGRLIAVDSLTVIQESDGQALRVEIDRIVKSDFSRSHALTVAKCIAVIAVPLALLALFSLAAE